MVPQRVSLITLGAKNLLQLRKFYQDIGWKENNNSNDNYAVFINGGVFLTLYPFSELVKDADIAVEENDITTFRGVTFAINVDKTEEVDMTVDLVKKAGATILRQASDAFWVGRTAYFADPEYNIWEVAWNPNSVFDERGAMISF